MDDTVNMLLKGTITELIMKLEPNIYRKYIWKNKAGKTHAICIAEESNVWHTKGSPHILEAAVRHHN